MKVVILAGGLGTRLAEETEIKPKPMVEIGGRPILWHIMKHYSFYGFNEFYIALGYKGEFIKQYFMDYTLLNSSMTINLGSGKVDMYNNDAQDWIVHLIDTGQSTMTGGRIKRLEPYLQDTFMVTYGDGVCNLDLQELLNFHKQEGKLATVTAVRPPARFGELIFDGNLVTRFTEKPQIGEGWINGGFMVLEPGIFNYLHGDSDSLESDALTKVAADRQLTAYRHDNFWQCMDTLRDKRYLEDHWQNGNALMENMVNFWSHKRVLVTGATGLVGSWLVKDLLAAGAYVVALVRDPDPQSEFYRSGDYQSTTIVKGQLEDYWSLERAINENQIDTVFHLAAQPIVSVASRSPLQTFESNVRGTYNLLESCRQHSQLVKRVVVASSDKAYGEQPTLPYTEDMPLQGHQPYEVSKSCADLITQSYFYTYGLPITIARCGNIYGGGDLNWSRIVPDAIRSCLQNRQLVIRSDGKFVRDYMYVKDVCQAYLRLAECTDDDQVKGQAFNFSPGKAMTVLELVEIIQRLMGCETLHPIIQNKASGEIFAQYLDSTRADQLLDWQPQYTLEAGMAETIDWYRAYLMQVEKQ